MTMERVAETTAQPAVVAHGLSKRYGRTLALDGCELSLPEGSFTALVGANGAGKTTLLLTMVGLLVPSAGRVSIFGFIPHKERRNAMARIGFVAQDRPLYPSLTVGETLEMGRRLNATWDGRFAANRLIRLGIPRERAVGKLSGGQQAQVALSLALGKRPRLLLLDEPMASLDPLARQLFLDELVEVSRTEGITVILSSHVLAELARVCNYAVVLQAGRIRASGPVESIIRSSPGPRDPSSRSLTDLEESVLSYLREGVPR